MIPSKKTIQDLGDLQIWIFNVMCYLEDQDKDSSEELAAMELVRKKVNADYEAQMELFLQPLEDKLKVLGYDMKGLGSEGFPISFSFGREHYFEENNTHGYSAVHVDEFQITSIEGTELCPNLASVVEIILQFLGSVSTSGEAPKGKYE